MLAGVESTKKPPYQGGWMEKSHLPKLKQGVVGIVFGIRVPFLVFLFGVTLLVFGLLLGLAFKFVHFIICFIP
jgi:hypothetical protein